MKVEQIDNSTEERDNMDYIMLKIAIVFFMIGAIIGFVRSVF